jgi:hypothetical protein
MFVKKISTLSFLFRMNPNLIIVPSTLLLINALSEEIPVRAPAPTTAEDCACKCRTTIYKDFNHHIQGNCMTMDRKWCFINREDCSDKFGFDNRVNLWKSYEGCSSSAENSTECLILKFAIVNK